MSALRPDVEPRKRLELGLVWVRWFGVVLGLYLVAETNAGPPPKASSMVMTLAYGTIVALAVGNLIIWQATLRARTDRALRPIGLAAFAFDTLVLFALAWIYSYDPKGSAWVVLYILPLEGAMRYTLRGALAAVAVTFVNELAREAYLAWRFAEPGIYGGGHVDGYNFLVSNVVFRVGIQAIIAAVAGYMARSLVREARNAREQAVRFEEAARREAAARRELAGFNTAILTGVAAEDLDRSLQAMADAIGRDLGFESFTILLREGDDLVVKGMYGMPFYDERIPIGSGVTGTVAATGRPLNVPDVSSFEGYIVADPGMRAEMAVPMKVGGELIGVLDVESRSPGAFDDAQLAMLTRLADQIALVTHSNQLLSKQRETMERLRELDEMKSEFVAITSHELRTPLTAIRGFVQTLVRNQDLMSADQVVYFMRIIDRQTSRLAQLVEDLLLVSRIEAGTLRLQIEEAELAPFLEEAVDSFDPQHRPRIRLKVDGDGRVAIDRNRVEQILRNLVDNALKFSPPEAPVDVRGGLANGHIELEVRDSGVGIPAEALPRVFERFHQAGAVLTREREGAGLGLYITKRLVEAMGGSIDVESEPGKGSTFRVTLPREIAGTGALVREAGSPAT